MTGEERSLGSAASTPYKRTGRYCWLGQAYCQASGMVGLTLPSPCKPSILLNKTSNVLGSMPALPGVVPPWIVYVFPEFVTPYVNKRPLWPMRTSRTRGRVVLTQKSDWMESGGNTCEKV